MEYLISVVIPCFNVEKHLSSFMEKLVSFLPDEVEIILVDDGSTDNTATIGQKFAGNHININYLYQENNGVSSARNLGMDKAKGKYIVFFDADDEVDTKIFSVLEKEIVLTQSDIYAYGYIKNVFSKGNLIESKNYSYGQKLLQTGEEIQEKIKSIFGIPKAAIINWYKTGKLDQHKKYSAVWCYAYKKELLDKNSVRFNTALKLYEDGIFNCEVMLYCSSIKLIGQCLYIYNQTENGSLNKTLSGAKIYDNKNSILSSRNNIRKKMSGLYGLDISDWYSGSSLMSVFQLMSTLSTMGEFIPNYLLIKKFIKHKEVSEAISDIPVGGKLKFRVPFIMLKLRLYFITFCLFKLLNSFGLNIKL